ncbi:MAG: DUF4276 family protein [Clostridia bacterium]|nr:DUF4276 family protein [Clostridia bacterium]
MTPPQVVVCIVEGHGDELAAPILVRRLFAELVTRGDAPFLPEIRSIRWPKSRLVRPAGLEAVLPLAVAQMEGRAGAILVVLDADDDCPARLGPRLAERARDGLPNHRVEVVLANREFESWFLAALPSLAGVGGLPRTSTVPKDPESVRDAKGYLRRLAGRYSETVDQPRLAARIDLAMASANSPSFAKLSRAARALVRP